MQLASRQFHLLNHDSAVDSPSAFLSAVERFSVRVIAQGFMPIGMAKHQNFVFELLVERVFQIVIGSGGHLRHVNGAENTKKKRELIHIRLVSVEVYLGLSASPSRKIMTFGQDFSTHEGQRESNWDSIWLTWPTQLAALIFTRRMWCIERVWTRAAQKG